MPAKKLNFKINCYEKLKKAIEESNRVLGVCIPVHGNITLCGNSIWVLLI